MYSWHQRDKRSRQKNEPTIECIPHEKQLTHSQLIHNGMNRAKEFGPRNRWKANKFRCGKYALGTYAAQRIPWCGVCVEYIGQNSCYLQSANTQLTYVRCRRSRWNNIRIEKKLTSTSTHTHAHGWNWFAHRAHEQWQHTNINVPHLCPTSKPTETDANEWYFCGRSIDVNCFHLAF